MRVVVDKAQSRGYANHGWLKTHHTFSFANYYNPERVHFGMKTERLSTRSCRAWDGSTSFLSQIRITWKI